MVDKQENILVELDYDNISLIDPNKVIDDEGKISDRLVKQEDLVIYANLECSVLPRTKLAIGTAMNDSQRTISVGKINFLNPGSKTFFDTNWSDELTGKDTVSGKGVNQPKQTAVKNPNKTDDYYIKQSLYSNGSPGAVDNGLLGMKTIKVSIDTSFLPVINVELEDVKGRALFEGGNDSPYSAFFQLPYPQFTLTLKGFYGKAIKFPIMLQSFSSRFDPSSGNFSISLTFYGYKYTLLSYVNFGALMAVPQMYNNLVTQTPTSKEQGNEVKATETVSKPVVVSRGYQKMKEVYSIYKSKGLIDDNFPEITLQQLKYRLQNFIKEILQQFQDENMGILTDMSVYQTNLLSFQQNIFTFTNASWFATYMDKDNPIVLKNNEKDVYLFKESVPSYKLDAATKLESEINKYKDILGQNSVFGVDGKYTIGGITTPSPIAVPITLQTLQKKITLEEIDLVKSYASQKNAPTGNFKETDSVIQQYKNYIKNQLSLNFDTVYYFEGPKSFMSITDDIGKSVSEKRKKAESEITASLSAKFNSQGNGSLGFVPSIRNILAVFYCQGEAFLRLLDEVHKKAWDQRENKYRRDAIFGSQTTAPSVDIKTSTQNNEPIYPWPQVIRESIGQDNKEKFEVIYPGDQTVASSYRAYNPDVWPEVEFVEQFIKGYVERQSTADKDTSVFETNLQPNRISLNSIDFAISNETFQNKEESKYFYEIYERLILNSYYERFNKKSGYVFSMYEAEADDEAVNILQSLGADNPFLIKKIKEYLLDSSNYVTFLKHISNGGQGESWQNFIRGEFVTNYIRNDVKNPNVIYNGNIFESLKSQPNVSLLNPKSLVNLDKYFTGSSITNEFDFVDIYPITNFNWVKKNLANGKSLNNDTQVYETKNVISYNDIQKTIANFDLNDTNNDKRPFTHFNFLSFTGNSQILLFKTFYELRKYKDQFATEGNLFYSNYNNYVNEKQTTSILNSPYFINAIQKGVNNFRYNQRDLSPYKLAAYLFLNSLPLATLREKYKTLSNGTVNDLDYIISTLKKFGAVHKLPYSWILKYGSIWHRYKIYKKTGKDILDDVWTNFNYKKNWDPATSATTYPYNLVIDGTLRTLVLDDTTGTPPFTDINTGFYPQLVDDYNVFIQGLKLFSGQTQNNGTCVGLNISGTCTTFDVTGICESNGVGITINSITNNFIQTGDTIYIPQFNANVLITGQVSGVTGGTGFYTTPLPFNVSFSGAPFNLKSYANITNNTPTAIQIGQILSGQSISGITIQKIISGNTLGNVTCKVNSVSAQTFNFTVINPPLQVTQISNNVLSGGTIINGPFLSGNVNIISQISGTTGGIGLYQTSNTGQPTTSTFVVQNSYTKGISSTTIQGYLNNEKLLLLNTNGSNIYELPGFDPNNNIRTMRVSPWSVLVKSDTEPDNYFIVPSFGSNLNQAKEETFRNGNMKVELSNNPALFNGSVRMFWNCPQYGYFDNQNLVKNNPETYMKQILNDETDQQNFLISGKQNDYTSIEEVFSAFEIQLLDDFETHFLNFSSSLYDYNDILPSQLPTKDLNVTPETSQKQVPDIEKSYQNFHLLMRNLMKVSKPVGTSSETKLQSAIENQNTTFQQILSGFLNYNVAFKFGNPSNFDKRLFYTFSTQYIENPISYNAYEFGNLPPQISLAQSKTQNPKTWETLEYYVGSSTIPELKYKDSGSYITDFFIDLNVQFNEKNVVDFAPLIKIYATQKLNGFKLPDSNPNLINIPPVNPVQPPQNVPTPNPQAQQYQKQSFTIPGGTSTDFELKQIATLTNAVKIFIYKKDTFVASVMRDPANTIIRQTTPKNTLTIEQERSFIITAQYGSTSNNVSDPQFVSNIENILPSSQNSQVTTTTTTQQQAPAGFPINLSLQNSGTNLAKFYRLMNNYIAQNNLYIGNVLNVLLPSVRKQLPNILVGEDGGPNRAPLEAGFTEQTRVELWETFKALNDTWIAGFDFESKTLFEDVLLVDRASRNVGDKVLVDIYGIIDMLEDGASDKNQGSTSYKNTLLDMVTTILVQNNFQHFMLPAYVNFYNVQDASKNPTPRPDGTLEVGNMMFGTFLNVDYRQTSPKFLCYYVSKPSEHLDMKDNIDYRFRDDAFDLRRASDNPLVENQANKTDWAKSNKVVGFNVDVSRENQQIFKSFSVSQDPGKPTSESLEMLNQMANVDRNRRTTTQSVSLYNLYKNRSYSCSVEMMGCALIQPMMYFNIRNVPMFSGPYMITKVDHTITEGDFQTTFTGTRQPFYSLPSVDNFLQTLNVQILSKLQEKIVENEEKTKKDSTNVIFQAANIISNLDSKDQLTKNQDCASSLNSRYNGFTGLDAPQATSVSAKDFISLIRSVLEAKNYDLTGNTANKLAAMTFTYVFADSGNSNGTELNSFENNYSTINLQEVYGDSFFEFINRKYFCVSRGNDKNVPIVSFRSIRDFVEFVVNRLAGVIILLDEDINNFNQQYPNDPILATVNALAKQYVLRFPINQNNDVYQKITEDKNQFDKLIAEIKQAYNKFEILWKP